MASNIMKISISSAESERVPLTRAFSVIPIVHIKVCRHANILLKKINFLAKK